MISEFVFLIMTWSALGVFICVLLSALKMCYKEGFKIEMIAAFCTMIFVFVVGYSITIGILI